MVNSPNKEIKLIILVVIMAVLILVSSLIGFQLGQRNSLPTGADFTTSPANGANVSGQKLLLNAQVDHKFGQTSLPVLNRETSVLICNLSNVSIQLAEGEVLLEEALAAGAVMPEDIISWAKQDAAAGICKEIYASKNSLNCFIYRYSQLELCVYDDVYETPDGQQHLIRDLTIRESGSSTTGVSFSSPDENGKLQNIDREDWGLSFTVERAEDDSLRLIIKQSGGQQIGTLEIYDCLIYNIGQDIPVYESGEILQINANAETALVLNCPAALPSGEYNMRLMIRDKFDPTQVHPLMRDYEDSQYHFIKFTLP